ncbi:MAG: tandem-95 repeat protein, partial [Verrucomicrobiota bacterium]|nr:tandem-95 repeat protein [Verrucomicrobiota bacterium]
MLSIASLFANNAPTISAVDDQQIDEDNQTGAIAFTVGDVETAAGSLIVTGSSNDTDLVPNDNVVIGGSGANRTVTVTPAADQNGTALITLTVTDDPNGGAQSSVSFNVEVAAVNDAPTISAVDNQQIDEDNPTGAIAFTVGDNETAAGSLIVTGSSNDTDLVPNANVVIGGSGANRTVTVTPAANQNGTAEIVIKVKDGANVEVTRTFNVEVAAVNDAPTIDAVDDQAVFENSTPTVTITVQDVDGDNVSISGESDDSDRLINSNITDQTGSGASRTIQIELEKNVTGEVNVLLTASDGNGASSTQGFKITIQANSNNAPVVNFSSEINQINDELDQIYYPFSLAVSDPDGDSVSIKLEQLNGFSWVNLVGGGGRVITDYSAYNVAGNNRVKVTSSAHGFTSSDKVKISGYNGSQTYNGVHDIEVIDSDSFYLEQVNYVDNNTIRGLVNLYGVVNAGVNTNPSAWGSAVGIVPGNENGDKIRVGRNLVNFRITVVDSPTGSGGAITVTKEASIFIVGKNDFPSILNNFTSSIDMSDDIARGFVEFPASGALRDSNKASLVAKGLLDASHQVIYPFRNITITDSDTTQEQDLIISSSNYNLGKFGIGSPTDAISNNKKYKLDPSSVGNEYNTSYGFLDVEDHNGDGTIDGVKFPSQIEVDQRTSMNASQLQERLRNVWFYPTANINPIATISSLEFKVRVDDNLGLFREATTSLNIQSINISPEVTYSGGAFPTDNQRFVLNTGDIKPFSKIEVSDADGTGVQLNAKISIDDIGKGALVNYISWPVEFTGTSAAMNTWLDGLVFTPSAYSQNPVNFSDHPTFTIEIDDGSATSTQTLNISFDNTSKNYLVTTANDTGAGSLRNAVSTASFGDIITFALSDYPSTIRLNSTIELNKNLTIKGPGANLLRISGDSNGDGNPDVKIFNVSRVVSIDGVHFSDATSTSGGAVSVSGNGELYVTGCEFTDCLAEEWGGAIDVLNGKLVVDSCLFYNNRVSASSGRGGGAVSIYSNKESKFLNTTFSGNFQLASGAIGGGAVYVENYEPSTQLNVNFNYCTFVDNFDESSVANSICANVFGTNVELSNNIFSDSTFPSLWVLGASEINSKGGNISKDTTRVDLTQTGNANSYIILNNPRDITSTDPLLDSLYSSRTPTRYHALLVGSPAINAGVSTDDANSVDQRGFIRETPDIGAVEYGALGRLVINEIHHDPEAGDSKFIEIYNPQNSKAIDLGNFKLWVDGTKVADLSSTLNPSRGYVVNTGLDSMVSYGNVEIRLGIAVIAKAFYNSDYADDSLNNTYTKNSLALAPEFQGYAYLPSSTIGAYPDGGFTVGGTKPKNTSNQDSDGNQFGGGNSPPIARDDSVVSSEDEAFYVDVLSNDWDPDDDSLTIEFTNGVQPITTSMGSAVSILNNKFYYNPISNNTAQSVPLGVEFEDSFVYRLKDSNGATASATVYIKLIGANDTPDLANDTVQTDEDTVLAISTSSLLTNDNDVDSDDSSSTLNVVGVLQVTQISSYSGANNNTSIDVNVNSAHGLNTGDNIFIAGHTGSPPLNDIYEVEVIDDNTFRINSSYSASRFNGVSLGYFGVLNDDNRLNAVSEKGANVTLDIRANSSNSVISYDPSAVSVFNQLAQGNNTTDSFWYAVEDSHKGISVAKITVTINGVNDSPVVLSDPAVIDTYVSNVPAGTLDTAKNLVESVTVNYVLLDGQNYMASLKYSELSAADIVSGVIVTDELTEIVIQDSVIKSNDTDVDTGNTLTLSLNKDLSELGAALTKVNDTIKYNPSASSILNKLSKAEYAMDVIEVTVTDSNGATGQSYIAVLVRGVNDTPVVVSDNNYSSSEGELFEIPGRTPVGGGVIGVLENDSDPDVDGKAPDDTLFLLDKEKTSLASGAEYTISNNKISLDLRDSDTIDSLAQGQSLSQVVNYDASDGSLIFASEDTFSVSADSIEVKLDVLLNDINNYDTDNIRILNISPPSKGGLATIVGTDSSSYLSYSAPVNYVGDEYFTYSIGDSQGRIDTAQVRVRLIDDEVNGKLSLNPDYFTVSSVSAATELDVIGNDFVISNDQATTNLEVIEIVQVPPAGGGTVTLSNGKISYQPDQIGQFSFKYKASAGGVSADTTVTVNTVSKIGSVPVRNDEVAVTAGAFQSPIYVLANDSIISGPTQNLTISNIIQPDYGSVIKDATGGHLLYTAPSGFVGTASFQYTATDDAGGTGTASVVVKVGSLGVLPDNFTAIMGQGQIELDVLNNDPANNLNGGNVTISNNITFITPEELGIVNVPIGHVTGTRSVSGSFTCYLTDDTNTS